MRTNQKLPGLNEFLLQQSRPARQGKAPSYLFFAAAMTKNDQQLTIAGRRARRQTANLTAMKPRVLPASRLLAGTHRMNNKNRNKV